MFSMIIVFQPEPADRYLDVSGEVTFLPSPQRSVTLRNSSGLLAESHPVLNNTPPLVILFT